MGFTNATMASHKSYRTPWVWVDLEASGIDPRTSEILEINLVVTDSSLEPWDSLHVILHHPLNVLLAKSSPWCKRKFCDRRFGGNGLFNDNHYSNISHEDAEYMLWNFFEYYSSNEIGTGRPEIKERMFFDRTSGSNGQTLNKHDVSSTSYPSKAVHRSIMLAGSTVHFDRQFILSHFPCLQRFLNHKVIDVATLLESARRFNPGILTLKPKPSATHRARDDILDSLKLFKFFKEKLFD